ncbi:MAG: hotdog domain-containing protein [Nannocystaceae bacterium]
MRSFQIEHDHGDFHGLINPAHFFTWFAACTHALLGRLGLDPEGLRVRHEGYVTPLVDARVSLLGPVQVGDRLDAHTRVTEIGESRFAITHRFFRGTMPICEGHELRLWATLHPLEPSRYIARVLPHDVVRALMGNVCWLV